MRSQPLAEDHAYTYAVLLPSIYRLTVPVTSAVEH